MTLAKNKTFLLAYKFFFGALGLSALATEVVVLVQRQAFIPANFFSYFTVQSNLIASAILIIGAVILLRGHRRPDVSTMLRGAATLYMVMTGIIFAMLLSGYNTDRLTAVPWDNIVLHYIMPFAVFVDWLIDSPRRPVVFKKALVWLIYPVMYVAYTLVRGHFVGWYPYPFLNPTAHGYTQVVGASIGIAVVVFILAWVVAKLPGIRR